VKASYGSIEVKGGIAEEDSETLRDFGKAMLTACPECGQVARLPLPPFTFTREPLSIGPASVKFPCGWHGYLSGGNWLRSPDSACGQPPPVEKGTKVANKEDLKLGDHVSFLRSENKAVSLTGKIVKIHEDGVPCVDVSLDDHDPEWIETAHVDDVTLLDESRTANEVPRATTASGNADSQAGKSLTTVNGVPV
jgi:hypothetical protein